MVNWPAQSNRDNFTGQMGAKGQFYGSGTFRKKRILQGGGAFDCDCSVVDPDSFGSVIWKDPDPLYDFMDWIHTDRGSYKSREIHII